MLSGVSASVVRLSVKVLWRNLYDFWTFLTEFTLAKFFLAKNTCNCYASLSSLGVRAKINKKNLYVTTLHKEPRQI